MPSNYAVIEKATGTVVNVILWDGESEYTPEQGFILVESNDAGIGGSYAEGIFTPPPIPIPTPEDILARNTSARDGILAMATLSIAPLQDAVDLEEASPAEAARLKLWKQYRVAVNRIDLTLLYPDWPVFSA